MKTKEFITDAFTVVLGAAATYVFIVMAAGLSL